MITWDDVELLDSTFADVDPDLQELFLSVVEETVNPSAYGGEDSSRTRMARMQLAAHLGSFLAPSSGSGGNAAGPVQSEKGGGLDVTYAVAEAAVSGDALSETQWGRAYEAGQKRSLGRGAFVL